MRPEDRETVIQQLQGISEDFATAGAIAHSNRIWPGNMFGRYASEEREYDAGRQIVEKAITDVSQGDGDGAFYDLTRLRQKWESEALTASKPETMKWRFVLGIGNETLAGVFASVEHGARRITGNGPQNAATTGQLCNKLGTVLNTMSGSNIWPARDFSAG